MQESARGVSHCLQVSQKAPNKASGPLEEGSLPRGPPHPQIPVGKGHWDLSGTVTGREWSSARADSAHPVGPPQVGPCAVTPRGKRRLPGWGAGVTALTTASSCTSSSRAHRPSGLRAIASLRRALASGPRRRPTDSPGQVPPRATLLLLCPARGAVPGVAGSERVAVGPAAAWRRGVRSLRGGGARQFPPSAPGAGDVPRRGPWVAGPAPSCPLLLWDHLDWRAF